MRLAVSAAALRRNLCVVDHGGSLQAYGVLKPKLPAHHMLLTPLLRLRTLDRPSGYRFSLPMSEIAAINKHWGFNYVDVMYEFGTFASHNKINWVYPYPGLKVDKCLTRFVATHLAPSRVRLVPFHERWNKDEQERKRG